MCAHRVDRRHATVQPLTRPGWDPRIVPRIVPLLLLLKRAGERHGLPSTAVAAPKPLPNVAASASATPAKAGSGGERRR